MKLLVTGSSGLIGSEAVRFFDSMGFEVVGIDNNMRRYFFGADGDTSLVLQQLEKDLPRFRHLSLDIRHRDAMLSLFTKERFDAVIHCAAQPSHDWARREPFTDFDINAVGTHNLLESTRLYSPSAAFVFMSTNKVYGDAPNELPLVELETRWDYRDTVNKLGVNETMRIDRSTHSIFGASKVAADIMVQEYGRYFGMKTVCLRGGCLTGPRQAGAELHGFLSYLVKAALTEQRYTIYGYKGKQVRDNIHSGDVVGIFWDFLQDPKAGVVYNLGGGRENSVSILEAIALIEELSDKKVQCQYKDEPRVGDHICYFSDLTNLRAAFPNWRLKIGVKEIIGELIDEMKRAA